MLSYKICVFPFGNPSQYILGIQFCELYTHENICKD